MDRLRRSLRESFRKKKDHVPECSKPHQWQADEAAVRAGTCNFPVKYLGCVEVFDSRGMQVCEEALKVLRNSRRRPIKGVLYVTGDGLRVVDEDTKGLIVDQTIEKVSFCAPDRNHEKGFSYICRDGTTRRWMCHGFLAIKDSGERLSHAVGCAFAACLERKQKRDKECGVTMSFDTNSSTFTRLGSFRQTTLTERMQDPQECKPVINNTIVEPPEPPRKPVNNPFAIERPHATPVMLQRQGSFRGFNQLNQASPFKRQLSLRINELPSNLKRQQRSMSLESSEFNNQNGPAPASPQLPPRVPRNRLHSLPNTSVNMSPIPESSPTIDRPDTISAMCQQVTKGLSMLSATDDPFVQGSPHHHINQSQAYHHQQANTHVFGNSGVYQMQSHHTANNSLTGSAFEPIRELNPWETANQNHASLTSRAEAWLASNVPSVTKSSSNPLDLFSAAQMNGQTITPPTSTSTTTVANSTVAFSSPTPLPLVAPPRRAPHFSHLRSQSLGTEPMNINNSTSTRGTANMNNNNNNNPHGSPTTTQTQLPSTTSIITPTGWVNTNGSSTSTTSPTFHDPFDAGWVNLPSTNPFQQSTVKAFEVHM